LLLLPGVWVGSQQDFFQPTPASGGFFDYPLDTSQKGGVDHFVEPLAGLNFIKEKP